MKFTRTRKDPLSQQSPVVITVDADPSLSELGEAADASTGGALSRALSRGEISGRAGSTTIVHGQSTGPSHIIVVGVGDGDREGWASAGSAVARAARSIKATSLVVDLPEDIDDSRSNAFVDAMTYGSYSFDRFRGAGQTSPTPPALSRVAIAGGGPASAALARRAVVGAHVNAARDLANTPGNHLTPPVLADYAKGVASSIPGLTCRVLSPAQLRRMGAGSLLCVAQGSVEPAQMIVMHWKPSKTTTSEVLGVVGKAVTFDTGGISIKPSGGMEDMKMDMGGGAATIEGIAAIAELKLPIEVLAVIPSVENMPDGQAIKPGDVVTAMNGKTIEVINTDAEGRLILADALTYAARNGATRLLNFATLTGAIVISLGEVYAGLFGSDRPWTDEVFAAGERSGDLVWQLPLHERYRPLITSKVADLTNAAKKRQASSIYAAMFLREFTEGLPWCHVDIAGTGMVDGAGTGFGVRLIVDVAQSLSESG